MADDREAGYQRTLQQYRDFPMPIRSAEDDERGRYRRPGDDHFLIRNLVFGGRDPFADDCRILVAGGGTGDSTLYFAKLINDLGGTGRVVHLDQSPAANRICRERLDRFGLDNVDIQQRSLFDLDPAADGPFDYVNCNGVLHHLSDPDRGLRSLTAVTKPDGGLGIWIYAKYGRAGMYHVQRMMLDLVGDRPVDAESIALTKAVLDELPQSSLGHFDGARNLSTLTKHSSTPDAYGEQLVDRFLNSSDHPFSAREMFEFVERAGLGFLAFQQPLEALLYEPLNFVKAPALRAVLARMSLPDRAEFAERWHCRLNMHRIYLAKGDPVRVSDPGRVLRWLHDTSPREFGPERTKGIYLKDRQQQLPVLCGKASADLLAAVDGKTPNHVLFDRLGLDADAIAADEFALRIMMTFRLLEFVPPAG